MWAVPRPGSHAISSEISSEFPRGERWWVRVPPETHRGSCVMGAGEGRGVSVSIV